MAQINKLRLMAKVARMYYQFNMSQSEIANRLCLSQATVSRLLRNAKEEGLVRIFLSVPRGVNIEIEEELIHKYNLKNAIAVDCESPDEVLIQREIGSAAAFYFESVIKNNDVVGISSWSETLLALVEAMHQVPGKTGIQVVQILGSIGNPSAEIHANRLIGRLSSLLNATPWFLPAPAIVGSESALRVLLEDPYVQQTMQLFDQITIALVGIGSIKPSKLLTLSGNIFSLEEQDSLIKCGAVGDILLRFFDINGKLVKTPFSNKVVSMNLEQLRRVRLSIGVAGGDRKYQAILGALRGNWINVLVTDKHTAERLAHA
jgi:DNA-binding transcriptional regulator LsrR (DeoR family)